MPHHHVATTPKRHHGSAAAACADTNSSSRPHQLPQQVPLTSRMMRTRLPSSRRQHNSSSRMHASEQGLLPAAAQIMAQQAALQRHAVIAAAAVLPQQQHQQQPHHHHHQEDPLSTHQPQQEEQHHLQQLPLLPPSLLKEQQQEQQAPPDSNSSSSRSSSSRSSSSSSSTSSSNPLVDPSALSITDRVRLLTSNAAARRRGGKPGQPGTPGGVPVNVLQYCAAAGLSSTASQLVLKHVRATRISGTPDVLGPYVASYKRLAAAYGEGVVLEWLRKAPPIIRMEEEVPSRLAQLLVYLGPNASLSDVLALTKRCPQVLQVSRAVLVSRMSQLCSLLRRDPASQAGVVLVAAPALLAMQPHTLQLKLQQLQALAATHPSWLEAYSSCPSKTQAVLLTYSLERQLRLHYAAAHSLQSKLQMNTVMAWSKRDWLKAHPDFEQWCQVYKRQQAAAQAVLDLQQQQQAELLQQQQQQQQQQQAELQQQQAVAAQGAAASPH